MCDEQVSYILIWHTSHGEVIGTSSFANPDSREQKVRALLDDDPGLVFEHGRVESRNHYLAYAPHHR